MTLHPKVRAAAIAAAAVVMLAAGAYLNGTASGKAAMAMILSGLAPVLAGYAKSAP